MRTGALAAEEEHAGLQDSQEGRRAKARRQCNGECGSRQSSKVGRKPHIGFFTVP